MMCGCRSSNTGKAVQSVNRVSENKHPPTWVRPYRLCALYSSTAEPLMGAWEARTDRDYRQGTVEVRGRCQACKRTW